MQDRFDFASLSFQLIADLASLFKWVEKVPDRIVRKSLPGGLLDLDGTTLVAS
jgi:hypothetical protein